MCGATRPHVLPHADKPGTPGDENELLLAPTETEGGYDSVEALSDWLYNRGIHNIGTASRFPVALVNPEAAAMASVVTAVRLEDVRAQVLRAALERVNMRLTERYTDDISRALGAIRGGAKHMWLSERKGKGALTPEKPLVWSYFTRMGDHVFANNGFIWGGDPEIDFTCVCCAIQTVFVVGCFVAFFGCVAWVGGCGA